MMMSCDGCLDNIFEILKWDSSFFDFLVAKLLPESLTESQLRHYLERLKELDAALVYWACDPLDNDSQDAAKALNGFLADQKVTYQIELDNVFSNSIRPINQNISEYTCSTPDSRLISLALQSGVFSRFNTDPKFSREQYERLYTCWAINSVNHEIADIVWIAAHEGDPVGMVTATKKQGAGQIGLLAVDEKMRGQQIGTDLVRQSLQWFLSQGIKTVKVQTQAENAAACRLYEKCDFKISKSELFYHFWL